MILKTLKSKLITATGFSAHDWLIFFNAWAILPWVDLALRIKPYKDLAAWSDRYQEKLPPETGPLNLEDVRRVKDLVDVAARYQLPRKSCLRRVLVTQHLLARDGIRTAIRFGVRHENNALLAHAWLEYRGQPLGEPESLKGRYQELLNKPQQTGTSNPKG